MSSRLCVYHEISLPPSLFPIYLSHLFWLFSFTSPTDKLCPLFIRKHGDVRCSSQLYISASLKQLSLFETNKQNLKLEKNIMELIPHFSDMVSRKIEHYKLLARLLYCIILHRFSFYSFIAFFLSVYAETLCIKT